MAKFFKPEMELYAKLLEKKKDNLEKQLYEPLILEFYNKLNNLQKKDLTMIIRDVYFCFGDKNWLFKFLTKKLFNYLC